MAFSYSFHLSSKGHSVSTIAKIGQVSRHNLRDYKSADYDKNDIQILVGGDKSILQNMREVYQQEFDEALKKYNEGKRADRQIEDYLKHISEAKADVGAEIIIQVGDKDFWEGIDKEERKSLDGLFEKQLEKLQELVPEFKVASAVIHYDESSPHMHIVGVPVSEGFKKGLEKQVSKTRVFTADRLTYLQDKMRENVEECMKYYPEIFEGKQLKEKEKGRNKDIPKQKLYEYYQLEEKIISGKEEVEFWKSQEDLYMQKAIQSRDEAFVLQDQNEQLKEENEELSRELSSKSADLDQKAEVLKKVDAITLLLSQEDREPIHLQDFTIPEKKTFLGRVEEAERQGTFVEGLDKGQVKSIMQRVKAEEGLESAFDRTQERCNAIIQKAKEEAKEIRSEASAEKNETVAKAQEIVNQQNIIIQKAKEWADNLKKKYNELVKRLNELLDRKDKLEQEVAQIEVSRGKLEPLRQEVAELTRAHDIMSGKLDNEITQATFRDWSTMRFGAGYDEYRKRGELLALYKDGTVRQVGRNESGGWDRKTLEDQEKGLCRVGIMQEEERVPVPRSVLKELIEVRDRTEPISKNLQNLIQQQSDVDRAIDRHRCQSR